MDWSTIAALVSAFIAVVAAVVAIVQTSAAKDQASSARDSATAAEAQAVEAERSADAAEQQVLEARRAAAAAEATLAQMKIDTADRRREEISRLSHSFIAVSEEWIASVTALIDHLVEYGGQPHPSDEAVRSRFMGAANAVIPSAADLLPSFGRAQALHEPYGDLMRAVQATHSAMQALTSQSSVLGEHEPSVVAVRDSVIHARAQSSRFQTQLIRGCLISLGSILAFRLAHPRRSSCDAHPVDPTQMTEAAASLRAVVSAVEAGEVLADEEVPTARGGATWHASAVRAVLNGQDAAGLR